MKRIPKYKTLPAALLIYFVCMAIFSLQSNGWKLQKDFWLICVVELVIIGVLYWTLKYLYNKRNQE